jgi:hypothetical protein
VACLSESAEMACAWIDKKDAAIGRLQQRRHRSLRLRHVYAPGPNCDHNHTGGR